MIGMINGMQVIASTTCVQYKLIQKRKHRAKRINKKWLKRYGYKSITIPDPKVFIFDNKIICHPEIARKLLKAVS